MNVIGQSRKEEAFINGALEESWWAFHGGWGV